MICIHSTVCLGALCPQLLRSLIPNLFSEQAVSACMSIHSALSSIQSSSLDTLTISTILPVMESLETMLYWGAEYTLKARAEHIEWFCHYLTNQNQSSHCDLHFPSHSPKNILAPNLKKHWKNFWVSTQTVLALLITIRICRSLIKHNMMLIASWIVMQSGLQVLCMPTKSANVLSGSFLVNKYCFPDYASS